jgi:hypothetical protein
VRDGEALGRLKQIAQHLHGGLQIAAELDTFPARFAAPIQKACP